MKTKRKELKPVNTERLVLTRVEAAEMIGVSVPTLWRLVKDGLIPHVMIGKRARYRREDIENYLAGQVSTDWTPTPGNSRRKG